MVEKLWESLKHIENLNRNNFLLRLMKLYEKFSPRSWNKNLGLEKRSLIEGEKMKECQRRSEMSGEYLFLKA